MAKPAPIPLINFPGVSIVPSINPPPVSGSNVRFIPTPIPGKLAIGHPNVVTGVGNSISALVNKANKAV